MPQSHPGERSTGTGRSTTLEKLHRLVDDISKAVNTVCWNVAVVFIAAMLLIVLFQVVARYLFRAPPQWTAEAARYCMVWGGMLGATVAFRREQDPRLFDPPQGGSPIKVATATVLRAAAVLIFLLPVLLSSKEFLMRSAQRTTKALGIRASWVTAAVPVAVAVILLHQLAKLTAPTEPRQPDPKARAT